MKIALIGDPHAKLNSFNDIEKIINYVIDLKKQNKIDAAVFLGDLFDTHSVMRIEIWNFWQSQLIKLSDCFAKDEILIISGNHDKPGSYEKENMSAIATLDSTRAILIYDTPQQWNEFSIVPYFSKEEDFINACVSLKKSKYLICHQTFDGAKFDNGMYAPGGFDSNKIPHDNIISGHIHTTMRFGKVFYPGTARWESASDANKNKGIYVLNTETDDYEFYPTNSIVQPMYEIELKENESIPQLQKEAKYFIHLIGTSKWVNKHKKDFNKHKIKTTYTDVKIQKNNKKTANFEEYLSNINLSVKKEDILKLVGEI